MKKVLITGITGQCGSILARYLLKVGGYEIYGMVRRSSNPQTHLSRIADILDNVSLVYADLADQPSIITAICKTKPDIVVNLASQSFVTASFSQPILTYDITGLGVLRILEAIKTYNPAIKFIQASSSEQYGLIKDDKALNEDSPFFPMSPYASAKILGYHTTINYRNSYNLDASCAILFNYESEFRSPEFVTRKITQAVAKIKKGLQKDLFLGNLNAKRDWTYALDSVKALHLMMQQDTPDDYVIASGECHSVQEFCDVAFAYAGLDPKNHVKVDEKLFRPSEVPILLGDATKIRTKLGWKPEVSFEQLVKIMVDYDLENTYNGLQL